MMIQPPTQSAKKPSPERTRAYQAPHLAVLRQQGPAAALASVKADLDATMLQLKDADRLGRQMDEKLYDGRVLAS